MAKDNQTQQNTKLVTASVRGLPISPRKMRLVTNLVKGMRATDAMSQLQFLNKKGAPYMARLIRSAIANAENNFSLSADNLYIKSVTCDMGQTMKRYFPRARGSAFIIRRKQSGVNLVLEERGGASAKPSRFSGILRRNTAKKEKAPVTKEGSVGVPESGPEAKATPAVEDTSVQARNVENNEAVLDEKTGPEHKAQ